MIDCCCFVDGPVVLNGSKNVSTTAAGAHHSTKKCAKNRVAPSEAWPIFCSPQYTSAKNSDPAPAAIAYEVGPLQVLVALLSSLHFTPAAAVTASEPTRMMAT